MFDWLRRALRPSASAVDPQQAVADHAAAIRQLGRASFQDKGEARAELEMGNKWRETNHHAAAETHYRQALAIHPGFAPAHSNLGSLLKDLGRLQEAEYCLSLALELQPDLGPACFNLAMMRIDQARWGDAVVLLRRLLAIPPPTAEVHYWLGNALTGTGDAAAARKAYQAAVRINPAYVQARWGNVMAQLPVIAQTPDEQILAVKAFAHELDKLKKKLLDQYADGGHVAVGAQQPYFLAYIAANHRVVLSNYGDLCAALMANWARRVGVPPPSGPHAGKLKLGIVSAHVHSHSVWHALVRGWVEHLDSSAFEVQIFHTGAARDAQTEWAARRVQVLHQGLGHWTNWVKAVSDARLDVLIYPEIGMDATTIRLSALRLARVQLASWGHPLTTGLPTIDGYLGAEALEPPGAAEHYREHLLTLPRLGCCYQPFGTAPSRVDFSACGIQATDKVLLCAGTPFKYAPQDDAALVEIARRCQPCKLVFFQARQHHHSQLLEQRLRAAFAAAAVDFDATVVFVPWQPQAAFFAWLDRTDVYLDSIGFSGFNTAMQAVERCTPIVAFEGEFMRGRFASAILRQMGLDGWVASSVSQYIDLVERLVQDTGKRKQLKALMSDRKSTLFDDHETVALLGRHLLQMCDFKGT